MTTSTLDLAGFDDWGGASALPRSNGELIFDAPWQGRVFGLVVSVCNAGAFAWDEFKVHLIAVIDESGLTDVCDPSIYYRQFGEAFCRLAAEKGFFDDASLAAQVTVEAERLAHADHDHDHHHH